MEDRVLIERVLGGDREAFRPLVERYEGLVFGVVSALVGDRMHAEDLAQETFLAVFSALDRFDPARERFSVWIAAIARNKSRNHLKAAGRRQHEAMPADVEADGRAPLSREPDFFRALDGALAELPAEQRVAFVLAEVHGVAHDEIAAVEDVAIGTVKSRVHRARKRLRSALGALMEERT